MLSAFQQNFVSSFRRQSINQTACQPSTHTVTRPCLLGVFIGAVICTTPVLAADDSPGRCTPAEINAAVLDSFSATHDGWSSDEVLLQDELNARFIKKCRKACPGTQDDEFNWRLINLRKASQLGDYKVTKRHSHRHDAYRHAAEIAARLVTDRHEISTDRMLCSVALRAEFDQVALELAPDTTAYRLRKAAFGLRKSRQLRPELVVRVANWGREIRQASVEELQGDLSAIPRSPGVYLFRDRGGYLYIGEAADLRKRLTEHLATSDRPALANYLASHSKEPIAATATDPTATDPTAQVTTATIPDPAATVTVEMHVFPPDSPATKVRMRRAYESELIASRKPRFNVRP